MNSKRIIALLEDQVRLLTRREEAHLKQIREQSVQIECLAVKVEELTQGIESLQKELTKKEATHETVLRKFNGLRKLLDNSSEKMATSSTEKEEEKQTTSEESASPEESKSSVREKKRPAPKERGNNHAKRKEYFDLEEVVEEIHPSTPGFDREKAEMIKYVDSIRYTYYPPRFIKHIYRVYTYAQKGMAVSGTAPKAPLLNSNYDASFMAGILQLRFLYSLPVERIAKFFKESGIDIHKGTLHHLIAKSAGLMDRMDKALRQAILSDTYINMDETYFRLIHQEKNKKGQRSRKVYFWGALANHLQLVHFFYDKGSRSKEVLTNYVDQSYRGAIQTDGYSSYDSLETDAYPHAVHIACLQHCKRQFLDIKEEKPVKKILDRMNELYSIEHQMEKEWSPQKRLEYRNRKAPPVLDQLERQLLAITSDPLLPPKSQLSLACHYTLNRLASLRNYLLDADYALDNNPIERVMRYISLSRKNSLFCASHKGAERAVLLYSLACSCRLHNINAFDYFTDILNQLANTNPNTPDQVFRDMLPDKWRKTLH
jgi:hypothetical protein